MLDPYLVGNLSVFAVELRESFDVIAGEGDGDHQYMLLAACAQPPDPLLGAASQTAHRAHSRLGGEKACVGRAQAVDHPLHAGTDRLRVRITSVDHIQRRWVPACSGGARAWARPTHTF